MSSEQGNGLYGLMRRLYAAAQWRCSEPEVLLEEESPVLSAGEAALASPRGGALRVVDRLDLSWEAYSLMAAA